VDYGGIRNPLLGSKERMSETLHLRLRALCFYPTSNGKGEEQGGGLLMLVSRGQARSLTAGLNAKA